MVILHSNYFIFNFSSPFEDFNDSKVEFTAEAEDEVKIKWLTILEFVQMLMIQEFICNYSSIIIHSNTLLYIYFYSITFIWNFFYLSFNKVENMTLTLRWHKVDFDAIIGDKNKN